MKNDRDKVNNNQDRNDKEREESHISFHLIILSIIILIIILLFRTCECATCAKDKVEPTLGTLSIEPDKKSPDVPIVEVEKTDIPHTVTVTKEESSDTSVQTNVTVMEQKHDDGPEKPEINIGQDINVKQVTEAVDKPEPSPVKPSEPESKAATQVEQEAKPAIEPQTQPVSETGKEPEPQPQAESRSVTPSEPQHDSEPRPWGEPSSDREASPWDETESKPWAEQPAEPETKTEEKPETEAETETESKPESEQEKQPEPVEEPAEQEAVEKAVEKAVEEPAEEPAKQEDTSTFKVVDIEFSESKIFEEEELDEIVRRSREEHDGIDLLNDVVDRVNDEYEKRGYPNARAHLPEQEVSDGVFHVELIEGRLGNFIVVDNRYTRDSYYLYRFTFDRERPLSLTDFEYQLKVFNKWNDGFAATATINPGETAGTSDIVLHAVETYPNTLTLMFDNAGSEGTGKTRFGVHFAFDSLYKTRDILLLGINFNPAFYSPYVDYSVLTPRINLRVGLKGSLGRSNVVSGPAKDYHIKEYNESASLYFSVPVLRNLTSQMGLSLSGNYSHAKSEALGVVLSEETLTQGQLGADFTYAPGGFFLYAYQNFSLAVPVFDEKSSFFKLDGGISVNFGLFRTSTMLIRAKYQYAQTDSSSFPGSLQFQVGGASTVRGYAEGCAWGKDGVLANVEYHIPVKNNKYNTDLFAFADFAYVLPEPDTGENIIWSWGLGAEMSLAGFTVGVALGLPQIDTTQDPHATAGRLHFSVKLSSAEFDAYFN